VTDEENVSLIPVTQSVVRILFERQMCIAMFKKFTILRNAKGYYLLSKIPLLDNMINRINPLHISTSRTLK
jgi:hypothetical protein